MSSLISVNIKSSTGATFSVQFENNLTVGEFKQVIAEKSSIPATQQRLIFSGHVLKDERTVESYCKGYSMFYSQLFEMV
jgi:ubiquilin